MVDIGAITFMGQIPSMTIVLLYILAVIYYFYGIIPLSNKDPRINN
jgi:hypothetical protein